MQAPIDHPGTHEEPVPAANPDLTIHDARLGDEERAVDRGNASVVRGSETAPPIAPHGATIVLEASSATAHSKNQVANNLIVDNGQVFPAHNASSLLAEGNVVTAVQDAAAAALPFEDSACSVTISSNIISSNVSGAFGIDPKPKPTENEDIARAAGSVDGNAPYASIGVIGEGLLIDVGPVEPTIDARNNFWKNVPGPSGGWPGLVDPAYATAISSIPWASNRNGNLQLPSVATPTDADARMERGDSAGKRVEPGVLVELDVDGTPREVVEADVITASDLGSGYAVVHTAAGRWLDYIVDMQLGGTYSIEFRLADEQQVGGTFQLHVDGINVTGPIATTNLGASMGANMGDWSAWRTVTKTGVSLAAGQHVVRVSFDATGSAGAVASFNWFRFIRTDIVPAPTPKPAAPRDLAVMAISTSRIDLNWTDNLNSGVSFKIERALLGQTFAIIATRPAGSTSYSDTGLAPNTKYYYRIRATSAGGDSDASNVARTTTLAEIETPPPVPFETPPAPPAISDATEQMSEQTASVDAPASKSKVSTIELESHEATPATGDAILEVKSKPAASSEVTVNSEAAESSEIAATPEVIPALPVLSPLPPPSGGRLPDGWLTTNVGPSVISGNAIYVDGAFTVDGAGSDIWGRSDVFRFVYHELEGDGQIVARVASLQRTDFLAKAGVMMRETLAANSKQVSLLLTPMAGLRFLRRHDTGGATMSAVKTEKQRITAAPWLKLVRSVSRITAYRSNNGEEWKLVGSEVIELPPKIYIGLAVTSQVGGTANVSTFDNVSVIA